MIDTHCHLLPSLDDGPRTLQESVDLAKELVDWGVTTIVCTPHMSPRYPTDHELAAQRLSDVREALGESGIGVRLNLAAEIAPGPVVTLADDELRRRSMVGRFVLVEMTPDAPAHFPTLAIDRLDPVGLVPVFAHPERCRAVRRDGRALAEASANGAIVQVVASSLAGSWGNDVARAAWDLIESGRADIVASDAHHARSETPLKKVLEAVADRFGRDALERLVSTAPAQLVAV